MKVSFSHEAWEDYVYWQKTDKRILSKINSLIKDIKRRPFQGLGKPELLKHQLKGAWSRRINQEHRLVYRFHEDQLQIIQCRYHY